MAHIQIRSAQHAVSYSTSGGARTLTGYAIRFNELSHDLGGFRERILPDAWDPGSANGDVIATFGHNTDQLLGRVSSGTLKLSRDAYGVRYSIDLPNTSVGHDVAELAARGDLAGSSFTFRVSDGGQRVAGEKSPDGLPIREITSMTVFELGPVVNPAYPTTGAPSPRALSLYSKELRSMSANSPINTGAGFLPVNRRSIDDVSTWTATNIDALWRELIGPRSTFLSALPDGNKLPFDGYKFLMPAADSGEGAFVVPGMELPQPETSITGRTQLAGKFGALRYASLEFLQDVQPELAAGINKSLGTSIARAIDRAMFNGASNPNDVTDQRKITGVLEQSVITALAGTSVAVADISDAIGRIEDLGGQANVLWVDPLAAKSLRDEIGAADWPNGVYKLQPIVSNYLPANTAIVADASHIFVALNRKVNVAVSETLPQGFKTAQAAFRATAYAVGTFVQSEGAVQTVSGTLTSAAPNLLSFGDVDTPDVSVMNATFEAQQEAAYADGTLSKATFGVRPLSDVEAQAQAYNTGPLSRPAGA
ncbi:HK97 family phage prohead protease [Streptomyces sp. DT224]|uniref:HK97 family phage prohead protease n=1 Tax=Streptomyces sp. DT224 TaxID=3393426 RepID=UPI003CF4C23B